MNSEEELPKDLVQGAKAFAESRKIGGKHARYSKELIDLARKLLIKYPITKVSSTLGVCAGTLRRWAATPKERKARRVIKNTSRIATVSTAPDFIEIRALPTAMEAIELRLQNGITIRLPISISPSFLAETCKHF